MKGKIKREKKALIFSLHNQITTIKLRTDQMINSVTIAGYLGKDPQVNYYNENVKVSFSVALNYVIKGEEKTHWIPVESWGNTALFVSNYLKKGSYVIVQGRMEQSAWEEQGEKKSRVYVYATQVESPKKTDEIPF